MFVATKEEIAVESIQNVFVVDRWCEVETIDGWKYADSIVEGDMLIVSDAAADRVIVSGITVKSDKIYYTVVAVGGDFI